MGHINANMHISILTLFLLNFGTTFIKCKPTANDLKIDYVPLIDLGDVQLDKFPACERALSPYLQLCNDEYKEIVNKSIVEHEYNIHAESVKKESCCGVWEAKRCVVQATQILSECSPNVTALFQSLPSDPETVENVSDICSEYGENTPICEVEEKHWFNLKSLTTILIVLLVLIVLGLVAYRFYLTKKLSEFNAKQMYELEDEEMSDISNDEENLNEIGSTKSLHDNVLYDKVSTN